MIEQSDYPCCCAANILYNFWKESANETNSDYQERVNEYLIKNIEDNLMNDIRFSIIILKQQQYDVLRDVLTRHNYKVVSSTLGNNGVDIFLLVKKTRDKQDENSISHTG